MALFYFCTQCYTPVKKSKSKDINEEYSFAYSTNASYNPFAALSALTDSSSEEKTDATNTNTVVELHYETKGRNGKPVTIVRNLPATMDIDLTASELKRALSTGGSVKDGEIILQGNCRKEVANWFSSRKIKTKNVGG